MRNIYTEKRYTKYIAVALAVIFLATTAFLLLEAWDNRQGRFTASSSEDGVVTYKGQEYKENDNIETFLVLGLDKFDGEDFAESHGSGVQADFLMLFVFDNEKEQCTALQINRDTMTRVNKLSVGGTSVVEIYTKQIALAYNYVNDNNDKIRCRNTKDSVEFLLNGVKVDHYLSLTMDSVVAASDLVGGVEVTVLDDFTGVDDTLVKGEKIALTGEQALHYVRTRYGLEDSSNSTRMLRQQQYINALYKKITSMVEADEEFIIELIDTMDDYVVYDSSNQKMQKFAEKFRNYEFLGIRELEGRSELGEEFIEFYPDEEALLDTVVELFYTPLEDES